MQAIHGVLFARRGPPPSRVSGEAAWKPLLPRRGGWKLLPTLVWLGSGTAAYADWVIPPGAVSDMGGGAVTLGCTDLRVAGTLVIGAGGSLTGVRSVFIEAGGSLQLDGGRLELAQQWVNQGSLGTNGGQVLRVDSPSCPAAGPLGPIGTERAGAVAVPTLGEAALVGLAAMLGWLGLRFRRRTPFSR